MNNVVKDQNPSSAAPSLVEVSPLAFLGLAQLMVMVALVMAFA